MKILFRIIIDEYSGREVLTWRGITMEIILWLFSLGCLVYALYLGTINYKPNEEIFIVILFVLSIGFLIEAIIQNRINSKCIWIPKDDED